MAALPTSSASGLERSARGDLALLAVVTIVLRLPAFFASAHLTFDDGVFGASAVAMREGGVPFRDVFSSQGPLFLPLVYVADLVGLHTMDGPRLLAIASALLMVLSTYVAGRSITDRGGALLAAGIVSVTATSIWITGPIAADGPALAIATATLALILRWRDDVTVGRAAVIGLGVGATISIKALLAPIALPAALVLLAGRRWVPIVTAAGTAVVLHFALWLPFGPADVWSQAYEYHLKVASERTPGANLRKVLSTMGDRDAIVLIVTALAIGATLLHRRARPPSREPRLTSPDVLLLAWAAGTALVLINEHPMWRPHVSQLIPALALLAARHRPAWRVLAVAGLVALPYYVAHTWPILSPAGYGAGSREAIATLKDLPDGALAISDNPGLVWRAGRRTPPDLVDASVLRIEGGDLTGRSVAEAAAADDVCAVVVTSRERWGSFDDLPDRLADAGYELDSEHGPVQKVYVKPACHP